MIIIIIILENKLNIYADKNFRLPDDFTGRR